MIDRILHPQAWIDGEYAFFEDTAEGVSLTRFAVSFDGAGPFYYTTPYTLQEAQIEAEWRRITADPARAAWVVVRRTWYAPALVFLYHLCETLDLSKTFVIYAAEMWGLATIDNAMQRSWRDIHVIDRLCNLWGRTRRQ